jgi:CHAT domain-containing protein
MRSNILASTLAIVLGIASPIVSAVVFPGVVIAQTVEEKKKEADRLFQEGVKQSQANQHEAALQSLQQALAIYRELKDREREGKSLGTLGLTYDALGNYTKAIVHYEQRLAIARELKDSRGEATAFTNLGNAYQSLGNYPKAIEYHEQRLAISRETKDRIWEGKSLNSLGNAYQSLGNYAKVIEYREQRLAIAREIQDRRGEGDALGDLGSVYKYLSNYDKSIEYQEQSLVISREIKDRKGESQALSNLGVTYRSLGNYSKAIYYHIQSLKITQELKNRSDEAHEFGNLGNIYSALGNYSKAMDYQEKSLAIHQELKDRFSEGQALGNLGVDYLSSGNYAKAIELFQKRLLIAQEFHYRKGEAKALHNLGMAYYQLSNGQYPLEEFRAFRLACSLSGKTLNCKTNSDLDELSLKAIDYWTKSLAISRQIQDRELERDNSTGLGRLLPYHNIELAIAFYKQSINLSESIRQKNQKLDYELQISYKETVAQDYRYLADLLLRRNRIVEALQVLDLLKAQDLQDFIKDDKKNNHTRKEIKLFPQEEAILIEFNNSVSDLNIFIKSPKVQTQTQYLKANSANQNLQLNAYEDLQIRVNKLGKNIALFYPLILNDRLELVILTNDRPPIHKPVPISRKQLETEVEDFRKQLQNRSRLIKEPAQKLYQSFIQPIEAELKAAGVDTIVYAPDDIMRYVPLAALHDGKQWLAERYQINYLTALALTPLEPDPNKTPRVLAAALTEAHQVKVLDKTYTFPALQFTQPEIETLAKTIPNTTSLINQSFSRQNLTTGIPNHTILHLATHGMFVPNSPDQSIIVMGDGSTINLREIEQQWKLPNVSLVVLSACETAIGGKLGNGIEILGFGYQMQRIGSRASISSLWTIDDGGTQGFMNSFYQTLKQGKTPAASIQLTQNAFIQGKITQQNIQQLRGPRLYVKDGIPTDLTHPYYWAPFILIGNGL